MEHDKQPRACGRAVVGAGIAAGTAVGIGVGSLASLTAAWWPILVLVLGPLGIRVLGTVSGRLTLPDRVAWLWPIVAVAVAVVLAILIPKDLAPIGLGLAVALWFATLIVAGILDVAVDPEGRWG